MQGFAIFDVETVLLSFVVSSLICTYVIFMIWRNNRKRVHGLGIWTLAFFSVFLGLLGIGALEIFPKYLAIFLGYALPVTGIFLFYIGLEKYLNKSSSQNFNFAILGINVILVCWFMIEQPPLSIMNISASVFMFFYSFLIVWLIYKRTNPIENKNSIMIGRLAIAFACFLLIRIVFNLFFPSGESLQESHSSELFTYLAFQILFILLTFEVSLMINRQLMQDLDEDIKKRLESEDRIRINEERYTKAFSNSPIAILITRVSDGKIMDVNDTFCRLTGYSREEALASTTLGLGLWARPEERENLLKMITEEKGARNFEFDACMKDGTILKAETTSDILMFGKEKCLLSTFEDISKRKLLEKLLTIRIDLWDYSASHTMAEVMQKALDDIEILTSSKISFYHFVDKDQKNLTLQTWSTSTREKFCKAEGSGMHYAIDAAGVWVDCVKERKPVIHNNYASLPHKKGMPDGHAEVVRELVVPTIMEGKIVSILGVGNKSTNYTAEDVELVEYIAGVVWVIIAKKRAEERVEVLNKQLEILAMTDELTGLRNRRSFFLKGREEILRAQRYHTPLSMIMLDIDHFKRINDGYGHDAGDVALKCIADDMKSLVREVDVVARLGGEEFVLLLPSTTAANAVILADRLRQKIAQRLCPVEDHTITLTASFGVSEFNTETNTLDAMLHNADEAMYKAKNEGRNRVVLYGSK